MTLDQLRRWSALLFDYRRFLKEVLLTNRDLQLGMGQSARKKVLELFDRAQFIRSFRLALEVNP